MHLEITYRAVSCYIIISDDTRFMQKRKLALSSYSHDRDFHLNCEHESSIASKIRNYSLIW